MNVYRILINKPNVLWNRTYCTFPGGWGDAVSKGGRRVKLGDYRGRGEEGRWRSSRGG